LKFFKKIKELQKSGLIKFKIAKSEIAITGPGISGKAIRQGVASFIA
jgi:hypothetical protein